MSLLQDIKSLKNDDTEEDVVLFEALDVLEE